MIDTRRWVLVEAWLALGLRIEWCPIYQADQFRDHWQQGEDTEERFVYAGDRRWLVKSSRRGPLLGSIGQAPQLGVLDMRHELAHYLAADEEQRAAINFGMTRDSHADEERAGEAEQVIDAMMAASARIASLALERGQR